MTSPKHTALGARLASSYVLGYFLPGLVPIVVYELNEPLALFLCPLVRGVAKAFADTPARAHFISLLLGLFRKVTVHAQQALYAA